MKWIDCAVGLVMCSAISLLGSAIWPFLFGALGWFVANFFARPFLDFLALRSQVQEEIIFTGNVGRMTADKPDYVEAVDSLRRLGAKMQAMDVSVRTPLAQAQLLSLARHRCVSFCTVSDLILQRQAAT